MPAPAASFVQSLGDRAIVREAVKGNWLQHASAEARGDREVVLEALQRGSLTSRSESNEWVELTTEHGEAYWHNQVTNKTSWAAPGPSLGVGSVVEARYKGRHKWFLAVIEAAHPNVNKYDLLYDDGDRETDVPRIRVRNIGEAEPRCLLLPGTACEAYFGGGKKCFPGIIVCTDTHGGDETYYVRYADGDEERQVPRDRICVQCGSNLPDLPTYIPATDGGTPESACWEEVTYWQNRTTDETSWEAPANGGGGSASADWDKISYWHNQKTHETRWEDPSGGAATGPTSSSDWGKVIDEHGNEFWHNTTTNETSWDAPSDIHAPACWERVKDENGDEFWHNQKTHETRWEDPSDGAATGPTSSSDWGKVIDEHGNEFWHNTTTNETSWESPTGVEAFDAPRQRASPPELRSDREVAVEAAKQYKDAIEYAATELRTNKKTAEARLKAEEEAAALRAKAEEEARIKARRKARRKAKKKIAAANAKAKEARLKAEAKAAAAKAKSEEKARLKEESARLEAKADAVKQVWDKVTDEHGNEYWHNTITNETSWEGPDHVAPGDGVTDGGGDSKFTCWKKARDERGKEYWYHILTSETSWEDPAATNSSGDSGSACWQKVKNEQGQEYWHNTTTDEVSWEGPDEDESDEDSDSKPEYDSDSSYDKERYDGGNWRPSRRSTTKQRASRLELRRPPKVSVIAGSDWGSGEPPSPDYTRETVWTPARRTPKQPNAGGDKLRPRLHLRQGMVALHRQGDTLFIVGIDDKTRNWEFCEGLKQRCGCDGSISKAYSRGASCWQIELYDHTSEVNTSEVTEFLVQKGACRPGGIQIREHLSGESGLTVEWGEI